MPEEAFFRQSVKVVRPELLAKWSGEVLSEGFVPFPKKLLRCLETIFAGEHALEELAVILAIIDYQRPNLSRPPSADFLAFLVDRPVDDVLKTLQILEDKNLICILPEGDGLSIQTDGLMEAILKSTDPGPQPE